jgi:broad specificity phosphatase PhoE
MKISHFVLALLVLVLANRPAAADQRELFSSLKQGGYVLVFRHVATDDSQKDVYPFKFDDMTAQRQLNDKGREMARQMGAAINKLEIPIGVVYTSRLNRAVETGKLLSGQDVKPIDTLTDSSAASTSGMANPSGANAKAGRALQQLVDASPKAGTNTLLVTHKTNITDAFGKEAADVQEGEAFVYKSAASGASRFVARIKAEDWLAQAAN